MIDLVNPKAYRRVVYCTVLAMCVFMSLIFSGLLNLDFSDDFIIQNQEPNSLAKIAAHSSAILAAVEGLSTFFFAIHTGLFVLVGFSINASLKNDEPVDILAHVAIAAFVLSSLSTFYFGFLVRFQVLERVSAGHGDFGSILDSVASQGAALGVTSIFAVWAAGLLLVHARNHSRRRAPCNLPALSNRPAEVNTNAETAHDASIGPA